MTRPAFPARVVLAILFILAGANHLRDPAFYIAFMPGWLSWHHGLIVISGMAEMLGGAGVLIPATRRAAGWGLVALLIAIFPANVHMASTGVPPPGMDWPPALLWARLPFQPMLIAWVWWTCLRRPGPRADGTA